MGQRFVLWAALAGMLMVAIAPVAMGNPFDLPPEDNPSIPQDGWVTSFPYQRNIDWDFSTDPRGGPTPDGAPGAHYEGYDDPLLWKSDFVEFTGHVDWYPRAPGTPDNPYQGVIGIDNRGGTIALTGSAKFHIDNWPENEVKHLYEEAYFAEFWAEPPYSDWYQLINLPATSQVTAQIWESPFPRISDDPILWRQWMWTEIKPNPPWEEKEIHFSADPGSFIFLDRLHIGTECVPEPATMTLLGGALLGLFLRRRRK